MSASDKLRHEKTEPAAKSHALTPEQATAAAQLAGLDLLAKHTPEQRAEH